MRVAVVGCGNMGRHHARVYGEMADVDLVAVVDPGPPGEAVAARHQCRWYESSGELYSQEPVDAVSVAVPTPLHADEVKRALNAGCHVLVEKPIASSVIEAEQLIAEAERAERVLTVGHVERFNPVVRALKDLIKTGVLGDVTSIVMRRVGGFPAVEPATDVLMDLAIHDLDLCGYLLGGESRILAAQTSRTLHSTLPDSASVLLENSGAACFVQANWITPIKVRTVFITGSAGHVEANYIGQRLELFENSPSEAVTTFGGFTSNYAFNTVRTLQLPLVEPLAAELGAFIRSVSSGIAGPDVMLPSDALLALSLVEDALSCMTYAVRDNSEGPG